ncbi:LysR family transcriptional regulator [Lichenifustis flavocetrariae]|uniref:LysR family transcriptional regulator n=1 Tax=Lichenifustis flavocetrariae TaxID=2949735 RepID=A0AA41Z798_9HYPH|nr:LysR family transcriptional regulator [Lichenifustis flavocetrariae]MCW6511798.1 LysR family transcriptional regulator [Lichenifustis flavocetrariae]
MIDRLTSMEVFVKAVDLGSFTAAAVSLGLSSQMVGKHIRVLEQRLGTQLMRRSTRRQGLTDAGRLFYERCRAVLTEVASAEAVVEDINATPRGRLRLSAPIGFGACRLAPLLTTFMERYPEVEVELILTDRYVDLIDEGFDAVFRLGPIADTSLIARELAPHEQVACASPQYLARKGIPQTPADLGDHDCLGFVNASGLTYAEWRFTARDGAPQSTRIRSRFQVNDGRVLANAAAAGGGIILQPIAVLRDYLDTGRLIPVLTDFIAPHRPMFLMFSGQRSQPPKLRALIDTVVAEVAPPR